MELDKIYTQVRVESLRLTRRQTWPVCYQLELSFCSAAGDVSVVLSGLRDTYSVGQILLAERLWLEVSEENLLESGHYLLGVSHETFTELVFDEIVLPQL